MRKLIFGGICLLASIIVIIAMIFIGIHGNKAFGAKLPYMDLQTYLDLNGISTILLFFSFVGIIGTIIYVLAVIQRKIKSRR